MLCHTAPAWKCIAPPTYTFLLCMAACKYILTKGWEATEYLTRACEHFNQAQPQEFVVAHAHS